MGQYKTEEIVFDIHGREGSYLALGANGHVVQPIYEQEDDEEPRFGQPEVWHEVFRKPPTAKLHAEVAEMELKLNAARTELYVIQAQRSKEDREYASRAKERERFAQLKTLDDYIAGKITHFFVIEGYDEIASIQAADYFLKENKDRDYDRSLRLVSLFGDSKGDLSWRVDRYSDGSNGSSGRCMPATSYEEALAHASKWFDERYAEMRKEEHKYKCSSLADAARRLKLPVPDDIAEWARKTDDATRTKNLEYARKQLAEAQKRVDELEEKNTAWVQSKIEADARIADLEAQLLAKTELATLYAASLRKVEGDGERWNMHLRMMQRKHSANAVAETIDAVDAAIAASAKGEL